jgi:hypothetical protein
MKGKKWLILLISLATVLLASSVEVTRGYFVDLESSSNNTFQAWTSRQWTQTTQADFNTGVLNNVDTSSSPGDVRLAATSNWYDMTWSRRAPVTIDNPGSGLTNYQVKVQVAYNSDMQLNFDDIRFTASNGTTLLSYWRESYTAAVSAIFWVKVPSVPAGSSTVYMYYGNAVANSTSDGASTFEFFDDFSSGLGKWTIDPQNTDKVYIDDVNGNAAPALRHDPDSSQTKNGYFDTRLITSSYTMQNGVIEYDVYLAGAPRIIHQLGFRVNSLSFTNGYCWRMQNATADGGWLRFNNGSWSKIGTNWGPTTGGVWHSMKLEISGTNFKAYIDGGSAISVTDTTKQTADYLVSHVHGVSLTSSSYVLVDNVRVRQYASQEPTASLGLEEGMYVLLGTLASQVWDTGVASARWDALFWDEILQSNTDITFEVRASDTLFAKDAATPSWISVGGTSPITSGLPSGRYMQWRATLTTSDTTKTPALREVRVYHY